MSVIFFLSCLVFAFFAAIGYNASISACEKSGRWQQALILFNEMQKDDIQRSIVSFNATIIACEKQAEWELALELFEQIFVSEVAAWRCQPLGILGMARGTSRRRIMSKKPLLVTFQTRSPCFFFSIFFLKVGWSEHISKNQTCFVVLVIIPSQKATLRLYTVYTILRHLHMCIIDLLQAADIFSYTSAISACATGGQWQQALNFFARMTLAKIQPQPGGKLGESLRSVVPLLR